MPPQSQEPEIHLLEKLVNSAVDADKKIESANKGELKENGGKTLEKYFIICCRHVPKGGGQILALLRAPPDF